MNKWKLLYYTIIIFICIIVIKNIEAFILKLYYPIKYEDIINRYADEYGVDRSLILAIIKNESNFNKNIFSTSNAKGLMQLLDSTANEVANEIGIKEINLFDEEINIRIGTYYISTLLEYYNNTYLALAAYNAGLGNVNNWIQENIIDRNGSNIENIPFKETENYIRKIKRDYNIYKRLEK